MKHLEWAIMNDRVREAKLMIENSDIDMSKSRLLKTHGLSEEMSEMLIEAGEPIRVEDFDEIVRNRDTSILERYIEAGAQITRKSLSQALHSCNDNKFAVILAAGLEQGIDQKTLYESMKTAIYLHSKPSFDLLREAGVVLDKEMHSWAKSTLENIADYPDRHPIRKELVAIYKECCEAIGVEPKGKLCHFRKQPKHVECGGGTFAGTRFRSRGL